MLRNSLRFCVEHCPVFVFPFSVVTRSMAAPTQCLPPLRPRIDSQIRCPMWIINMVILLREVFLRVLWLPPLIKEPTFIGLPIYKLLSLLLLCCIKSGLTDSPPLFASLYKHLPAFFWKMPLDFPFSTFDNNFRQA